MQDKVSIVVEIPACLHEGMIEYMDRRKWGPDRFATAAIALLLINEAVTSGELEYEVRQAYLKSLFGGEP